ncbi:peptide deformylase [Microbacterium sp. JZ31]|uniref:peptide deformylase n=1 Tax=Microbacterium sp. JZ31 TaxID=1906274 RepID=UPI0019340EF6|nr:peptide deformylase [Microbacterium sp. JZ31]
MTVLPIRIMGDPVLHAPAADVDEITDEIRELVADMFETMDAAPGVGLAAPQVGVPLRIYTYAYEDDEGQPWRGVILNPELWMTPLIPGEPDEEEESEGCLSFPGERFALRRSERVRVTGIDLDGDPVTIAVDGWRARIMQHEFDHLDGVLYIDRLTGSDAKLVQKIARKRGWGRPGASWMPGVDDLEG